MEWPFFAYEKIQESLERWYGGDEVASRALHRAEWVTTEKIHGANFSLVTDGTEIRCAKRKAFLAPNDEFFGYRAVLERISEAVRDIFARVHVRRPGVAFVQMYGELFGGGYPHPDVVLNPSVQPIQTGCWYSPNIEFCALDIAVVGLDSRDRTYLDFDEVLELSQAEGIFCQEVLFRGSYEEAIAVPLGFQSRIPARLGFPALPGNRAEGIVVKTTRTLSIRGRQGGMRPAVKRKIAEFAEDARFHQASPWRQQGSPLAGPPWELLRNEVSARMNEPRLQAAVSKVGRVAPGDAARAAEVLQLVVEDVSAEILEHHTDHVRGLAESDARRLAAFIEDEARVLIQLYLPIDPTDAGG